MGIRKVARSEGESFDPRAVLMATREYLGLGKNIKELTGRQAEIKKRLAAVVEQNGEEDDRGHVWLKLPEEVEGVHSLQRQRRVSQTLDEDRAEQILAEKGLTESCYKTITVLDEEAVMAAHFDGKISEAEIDAMFPKKVTYAFVTAKD